MATILLLTKRHALVLFSACLILISCKDPIGMGDWNSKSITVHVKNLSGSNKSDLRLIAIDGNNLDDQVNEDDVIKHLSFGLSNEQDTTIVWEPNLLQGYIHIVLVVDEMQSLVNRLDGVGYSSVSSYRTIYADSIGTKQY